MAYHVRANSAAVSDWTIPQPVEAMAHPFEMSQVLGPYGSSDSPSWLNTTHGIVSAGAFLQPYGAPLVVVDGNQSQSCCPDTVLQSREKRKSQNRQAQRAFRQRKEEYISQLEQEVEQLKSENESLQEVNIGLLRQLTLVRGDGLLEDPLQGLQLIMGARTTKATK